MRKTYKGKVIKNHLDKTVTVLCTFTKKNKMYSKSLHLEKKILAHDEHNQCKINDVVTIMYSRPISCRKSFVVIENK